MRIIKVIVKVENEFYDNSLSPANIYDSICKSYSANKNWFDSSN